MSCSNSSQTNEWVDLVWAATCHNEDFLRAKGYEDLAHTVVSRQELVAGNLQSYIISRQWPYFSRKSSLDHCTM